MNDSKNRHPTSSRTNLTKIRGLQDQEAPKKKTQENNLPNGWFYDESKQEDFWNDMENRNNPINMEQLTLQNKKNENISNIGDSSKRINSIIKSFDTIEEEVLVQMLDISPEMNQNGDVNTNAILDSTKTQVIQYCQDMLDVKKSQDTLFGSLKKWFQVLEKNELFFKKEYENTQDEPDINEVFQQFNQIMAELDQNSEKITYIHHDITDNWQKQAVALKKEIFQKDAQIHQLTESIESLSQMNKRNAKKKQQQSEKMKESEAKQAMLDNYIKQVEEQKNQIQKLKQQIINMETSRAATNINLLPISDRTSNNADINQIKLECETKLTILRQKIEQLENDAETFNGKLAQEKSVQKSLEKENNQKDRKIEELESALHKYIELLQLEMENNQAKPAKEKEVKDDDVNVEDLYLQIAQLKEEMKQLNTDHQIEMNNIRETERIKAANERQVLIAAMNSKGIEKNEMITEMVKEYDRKFENQKKEFDQINTDLAKNLGAKISVITAQYEQRIKQLNQEHQEEMIEAQNSINYNVKKARIEINEEFNNKLTEATRKHAEHELQMKQKMLQMQDELDTARNEASNLAEIIQKVSGEKPEITEPPMLKTSRSTASNASLIEVNQETKYVEDYLNKLKQEKAILQEQHEWELKQQKSYFESLMKKELQKQQEVQRQYLQSVINSLSGVQLEGENQKTITQAINDASSAMIELNNAATQKAEVREMITLDEANRRTKILSDRISQLTAQLNDRIDYSSEIDRLNKKINFLENLRKGETDTALDMWNEIEQKLKEEIAYKDNLIKELQTAETLKGNFYGDFYDIEIFSQEPEDESEEVITLTKNDPIVRSQPEIIQLVQTIQIPEDSALVKTKSNEQIVEPVIEKHLVPARINVKKTDGVKQEIRTVAVTKAPEKEVVKEIVATSERQAISPSIVDETVVKRKKNEPVVLEISRLTAVVQKPRRFELFIAPGSRIVQPKISYVELFGLIPGKKPPLIVLSDDWSKTVLSNLQMTLKNIMLAQKGITQEDKAKENFLGTMQVALIDSSDRIIVSDPELVTRIDTRIETAQVARLNGEQEVKPTNIVPFLEDNSPIYERPAPVPIKLELDENIVSNEEISADPFSSSITLLSEIIRFVRTYKENEAHIQHVLNGDCSAFEVYSKTHLMLDQIGLGFLKQVMESNQCYDKNIQQASNLESMLMRLLKSLQVSRKKGKILQDKINEMGESVVGTTMKVQEKILMDLSNDTDGELPSSVNQLIILNKIEGALDTIEQFQIPLDDNEQNNLAFIKRRLQDFEGKLRGDVDVDQRDIDYLLGVTQNLITEIKSSQNRSMTSDIEDKMSTVTETNQVLYHKYKKYKHGFTQAVGEAKQLKAKCQILEKRVIALTDKIKEEQESSENSISFYKAQVNTLNSIFERITNEKITGIKTPTEVADMIMQQVKDMKILIQTNQTENENLKSQAMTCSTAIENKDELIENLKAERDLLQDELDRLHNSMKINNEIVLFHAADMDKMRKENEAEVELGEAQRKQLDSALNANKKLREEILEKDKILQKLKFTLAEKEEQIDDLNIRIVCGAYHDTKTRISEGTQTVLRIISRKNEKAVREAIESQKQNHVIDDEYYDELSVGVSNENFLRSGGFSSASFTDSSAIFDNLNNSGNFNKTAPKPKPAPDSILTNNDSMPKFHLNLSKSHNDSSAELLHEESVEWLNVEENSEVYDKFSDVMLDNTPQKGRINDITNDSVQINVHEPLNWKKSVNKRKSIMETINSANSKSIKRPMTSHVQKPRKTTLSTALGDQEKLMIGEVSPGVRPLKGAVGKVHPTTTIKSVITMKSNVAGKPQDIDISPIKSARFAPDVNKKETHQQPRTSRTSVSDRPKINTARTEKSAYKLDKGDEEEDLETIRITNVQYEDSEEKKEKRPPIISLQPFSINEIRAPMTVRSQPPNYLETQLSEFKNITKKLQETIQSQKRQLEQNEEQMNDLKKRLAEALHRNQQLAVDVVRQEDKARRAKIRYDNVTQRLEIAMGELSVREEIIQALKREISKLRSTYVPAANAVDKLKSAMEESRRLKTKSEKQKILIDLCSKQMQKGVGSEVQEHLRTLMENTQKSIARNEAKVRMWRSYEKNQIMAALAALSLVDNGEVADKVSKLVFEGSVDPRFFDLWTKRREIRSFEKEVELM